ncbi:Adrenodoxin-like [Oopsacas minuta]|uniref:Adrenodoxin-like n=1 Tax=Oopsacas minuta TaxID=111878 RepID=A0AAV7KLC0_9METZ|nr:Adrenodoxin-like [Oopsacas minuta]
MNPELGLDNYSQKGAKTVNITFIDRDGDTFKVAAKVGDTLLDVAKENDIDVEGACGGTLACSTCHLIFEKVDFDKIPETATDEELDLLEMAYGLTDTSRLVCQIDVTDEMEGIVLKIPTETRDARNL